MALPDGVHFSPPKHTSPRGMHIEVKLEFSQQA